MNEPADIGRNIDAIRTWAVDHPFVRRIWIFGSRARGNHRNDSDLDVAIEIDAVPGDEHPWTSWSSDAHRWTEELTAATGLRVDLNYYEPEGDTPRVQAFIEADGKLLYARDESN